MSNYCDQNNMGVPLKSCYIQLESLKIDHSVEVENGTSVTPRKSTRSRIKPDKYGEFLDFTPSRGKRRSCETHSDESEECDDDETVCPQKPTALFSQDDVGGQDMFAFKSRHTKQDLHNKAKSAILNSPKVSDSPRTPRKSILKRASMSKLAEATPKHVKDIMKKRIVRELESDSADSDFSASSSDFVPDEDSENENLESESEASSASGSDTDEESKEAVKKVNIRNNTKMRPKDSEYVVTPDNYFMMNSSKKITTSDHTLERLKNFNLNDNLEQNDEIQLSEEHRICIKKLNKTYEDLFDRWLYVLSENFNIVLYGVGSKRKVLHKFQQKKLQDFPCIVVNGFFPSLTLKSILDSIIVDLLECPQVPSNIGDVVNVIDTKLSENNMDLFLIIHNIDGTMLRNAKTQAMLASISQIKNVHTIATIDHINAPLLWDHSKLSKFNFTWWDVTTLLPYTEETSFENSLLSHRTGALQLSSLRSVYLSLTSNAKGIFNIIIQYQLDNQKQPHYQGLPFRDLYSKSREQFLVSSDIALRAQLTEFLDHKLVKMKRTYDGSENLVIPIESTLLQQFLETANQLG